MTATPSPSRLVKRDRRKIVYLKQSDFDAHGLTQGCLWVQRQYERKVTQRCAANEWSRTALKEQRRANNDCRRLNAAHGTWLVNEPPSESSSSSPTDQYIPRAPAVLVNIASSSGDAASAGSVVAGECRSRYGSKTPRCREGRMGAETVPREKEDDEEPAKRQRTEKKTELEIEVSNVAEMNDSRRILDLRRDGWEQENVNPRDAAMFCACELRPRVMLKRCTKRTQLESTWDFRRAQGTQGLGFVCEIVGNIADDPMTKNIWNCTRV